MAFASALRHWGAGGGVHAPIAAFVGDGESLKKEQAEFVNSYADFLRSKECPVSEVAPVPALYEGGKAESGNAPDFDENRLHFEEHDGQMWINSLDVALAFGKEHRNVLADIDKLCRKIGNERLLKFQQTFQLRENPNNPEKKIKSRAYRMTRDGFLLLAFGWRDEKSRKLLLEYMNVFNKMESRLREQAEAERQKLLTERKQIEASREALLAEKGSWDARVCEGGGEVSLGAAGGDSGGV